MAVHQIIERDYSDEFSITVSFPMAGAYSMSGIMTDLMLAFTPYGQPFYFPFVLIAYIDSYPSIGNAEEYLLPEYEFIIDMFDGYHSSAEINDAMPSIPITIMKPDSITSFEENNDHPLRVALRENDLWDWLPQAPMYLFHGLGDEIVPSENSQMAYDQFIANDTQLNSSNDQIMIITGPNMAGKSTYLRQVSLITLMAQIGSFIPADSAHISIVDRIFSRVGAQDHLQKGMSTFMVEMNETANILNNATERSLIILDEIGRGTSTFDGISIAWSIVEYLHGDSTKGGPKTLFATHYHELTDLALVLKGVKNFNVQVKEWNNEIIFLRKIIPGGADKSYGIQVARLAGLPEKLLRRAHEVLFNLEKSEFDEVGAPKIARSEEEIINPKAEQLGLFLETAHPAIKQLEDIEPDNLSPRQAMETLYQLKNLIKKT